MKKIIAIILTAATVVALCVGCSSEVTTYKTDTDAPWYNGNHYERSEYDYTRYSIGNLIAENEYERTAVATGKYVLEMKGIKSIDELEDLFTDGNFSADVLGITDSVPYSYSLLTATFTATYNEAAGELSGDVDTFTSRLLFYSSDLKPICLHKTANYVSVNNSYDIAVDYISRTNIGSITADGQPREFNLSVGENVYDNDLMFYVGRSINGFGPGVTETYNVYSPVDSALYNNNSTFQMNFSTDSSYLNIVMDGECKYFTDCYPTPSLPSKNADGLYTPLCVYGAVRMVDGSTYRGSPTIVFYAADPFSIMGMTIENALLHIQTDEYDPYTSARTFTNSYFLSDYSIIKA